MQDEGFQVLVLGLGEEDVLILDIDDVKLDKVLAGEEVPICHERVNEKDVVLLDEFLDFDDVVVLCDALDDEDMVILEMVQDDLVGAILVWDLNKEDGALNVAKPVVVEEQENALLYEDLAGFGGCVVILHLALYVGFGWKALVQENHSLEFSLGIKLDFVAQVQDLLEEDGDVKDGNWAVV